MDNQNALSIGADRLLDATMRRKYDILFRLTDHGTVLGQFIEKSMMDWLHTNVIQEIYNGHTLHLGTGMIWDGKNRAEKGQCDILMYEALPNQIDFIHENLVVVKPHTVRAVIECKSTVDSPDDLFEALEQTCYLRMIAPTSKVYLFIRLLDKKALASPKDSGFEKFRQGLNNPEINRKAPLQFHR